jgi:hypothetical protein
MLPDIRAILAVVVAAVGLLAASFGLVATFRVAQESRSGLLQADLAQRGRAFVPASAESRAILLIEKPAPLEANPVQAVEIEDAPDIVEDAPEIPPPVVMAAPLAEPPAVEAPPVEQSATEPPPAEPPMGGPLPEQVAAIQAGQPSHELADGTAAKKKAREAAAKKARAARIARERRTAAKRARAAQARAKQQEASSFNNAPFGNSFGNFGNSSFGQ